MKTILQIIKSFKFRVASVFLAATLGLVLMFTFVIASSAGDLLVRHSLEMTQMTAEVLGQSITGQISTLDKFMDLGSSLAVSSFLFDDRHRYSYAKELVETLKKYYRENGVLNQTVEDIYILGVNRVGFRESKGTIHINEGSFEQEMLDYYMADQDLLVAAGSHFKTLPDSDISGDLFIGKRCYQPGTKAKMGVIVLRIKSEFITQLLQTTSNEEALMLYDGKDSIGKYPDTEEIGIIKNEYPQVAGKAVDTQDYHYFSYKSMHYALISTRLQTPDNWILVAAVNTDEIIRGITVSIRMAALAALLIMFFVTVIVSRLILTYITKPIRTISYKLSTITENEAGHKIPVSHNDEIAELEECYNILLERLKALRIDIEQKQIVLRQRELSLLQEQINPHFLYNTLELVMWSAAEANASEVVYIVDELAKFFRISLSVGLDEIPISKELEHVRSYLNIQRIRYGSKLTYSIDVDAGIMEETIQKITLQPIVENAIRHGMQPNGTPLCIRITGGRSEDGFIFLRVSDNGKGMEEETLKALVRSVESGAEEMTGRGYGLKNVQNRIRHRYGMGRGLSFKSEPNRGTEVMVSISLKG